LLGLGKNRTNARTVTTTETITAGVLLGPCGSPAAQGPIGTNDDYTNRSIDGGVAVTPDGLTASSGTVVFKNTVENTGPGDDAFNISAPSMPSGFRLELSTDLGDHYVTLDSSNDSITLFALRRLFWSESPRPLV
jgi:hypothetical protein